VRRGICGDEQKTAFPGSFLHVLKQGHQNQVAPLAGPQDLQVTQGGEVPPHLLFTPTEEAGGLGEGNLFSLLYQVIEFLLSGGQGKAAAAFDTFGQMHRPGIAGLDLAYGVQEAIFTEVLAAMVSDFRGVHLLTATFTTHTTPPLRRRW